MESKKKKRIVIICAILVCFFLFAYYENHHLVVSHYEIEDDAIPHFAEGYKIVRISDLHNASFGSKNKALLDKIKKENPDMIVLTGDLVDSNRTNVGVAVSFAKEAAEIAPVYYATGNHEVWLKEEKRKELYAGLKEAGVTLLLDEAITIGEGEEAFVLIGLDDESLFDNTLKSLIDEKKAQTKADAAGKMFYVVLAHEPQYLHNYALAGADLVLSGHAHGGQFRFPGIPGLYAPSQGFFPKYTAGDTQVGEMHMITSRGLGNSVIPLRLFNDPEIVVVTLKTK